MSIITEFKNKFNTLDSRERKFLISGIIFVSLFVVYSLIYKPMISSIDQLQKSNADNQQLLVWMTQSAATIKASSGGTGTVSKRGNRNLNEVINTTSSKAKISISRSQPRDNNQYQIWLDQVVFNDLLLWVNVLQNEYGVYVQNINLGTTDKKGLVRVNLTFQDSGS